MLLPGDSNTFHFGDVRSETRFEQQAARRDHRPCQLAILRESGGLCAVSGDVVALRPPSPSAPITASSGCLRHASALLTTAAPLHGTWRSQWKLNLFFCVACTLKRALYSLKALGAACLAGGIRLVGPRVRNPRVLVGEDAGNRAMLPFIAGCGVVPIRSRMIGPPTPPVKSHCFNNLPGTESAFLSGPPRNCCQPCPSRRPTNRLARLSCCRRSSGQC